MTKSAGSAFGLDRSLTNSDWKWNSIRIIGSFNETLIMNFEIVQLIMSCKLVEYKIYFTWCTYNVVGNVKLCSLLITTKSTSKEYNKQSKFSWPVLTEVVHLNLVYFRNTKEDYDRNTSRITLEIGMRLF